MTPEEIMAKLADLQGQIDALADDYYKNNFTATQDFQKYSRFNTRIKIPHYATNPATCEIGELLENGGVAYICSAANTWSKIGTQS